MRGLSCEKWLVFEASLYLGIRIANSALKKLRGTWEIKRWRFLRHHRKSLSLARIIKFLLTHYLTFRLFGLQTFHFLKVEIHSALLFRFFTHLIRFFIGSSFSNLSRQFGPDKDELTIVKFILSLLFVIWHLVRTAAKIGRSVCLCSCGKKPRLP